MNGPQSCQHYERMALLLTSAGRSLFQIERCSLYRMSSTTKAFKGMDDYWKKNRRLGRPLTPHLSVYKFEPNMAASITHRISGCFMVGVFWAAPLLYMCGSKDFSGYIDLVKDYGSIGSCFAAMTKAAIAFTVSYHSLNGIRHLTWDWAFGLKMSQVLQTGIMTGAIAAVVATCLYFL